MNRNGEIKNGDWKLWMCNQENGRDFLHSFGPEVEARAEMQRLANIFGLDVWLIAPNGSKHLPVIGQNSKINGP